MHSKRSIEDELRRRILDGTYAPGTTIPTRRDLTRELDVSSATLQAAVDRLIEQGFLLPHGKLGTTIAERLPNRACYAIVFGDEPEQGGWNRFMSAQLREARSFADGHGRRFKAYCLPNGDQASAAHQQLWADLRDNGLAGILFATPPHFLAGSPVMTATVPRVCVGPSDMDPSLFGSVALVPDPIPRILQRFAGNGRKRLAAICTCGTADQWKRHAAEARRHGLATRQEWWLGMHVSPLHAPIARTVTHLLFTLPPDERPDCLLIDDDNLVLHATNGVLDAGIRVPGDLEVMAHANFPHPTVAAVPCERFGVDVHGLLAAALDELDRQRAGGAVRQFASPFSLPG